MSIPFRVQSVMTIPGDRVIVETPGYTTGDYSAPYGGHLPHDPYRPAIYQLNYSGIQFWQTWEDLRYEPKYREILAQTRNGMDTVALLQLRNRVAPQSPAPIAIYQYALGTQQVYTGVTRNV